MTANHTASVLTGIDYNHVLMKRKNLKQISWPCPVVFTSLTTSPPLRFSLPPSVWLLRCIKIVSFFPTSGHKLRNSWAPWGCGLKSSFIKNLHTVCANTNTAGPWQMSFIGTKFVTHTHPHCRETKPKTHTGQARRSTMPAPNLLLDTGIPRKTHLNSAPNEWHEGEMTQVILHQHNSHSLPFLENSSIQTGNKT